MNILGKYIGGMSGSGECSFEICGDNFKVNSVHKVMRCFLQQNSEAQIQAWTSG